MMLRRNLGHKQKPSRHSANDPFRKALVLSGILHVGVLLLFSVSLPFLGEPSKTPDRATVTLVDAEKVAEQAKAPAAGEPEKARNKGESGTQPEPDTPPKQIKPAKPPQAPKVDMNKPPAPGQLKEDDMQKPAPDPAPRKPAPPKPETQKTQESKPDQQKKAQNRQEREEAEKQFNSVLKNLAEPRPDTEDKKDNEQNKDSDKTQSDDTKDSRQGLTSRAGRITMSEKQALRQQLSRCWNVLAGAKNAGSLVVRLRLHMNPDRTVERAELLNKQRYDNNPQFRAAADSALRAVQNPDCSPLKLPPEKYDQWKVITIRFDPEKML
jgi:type IV secretory pathway VirB10-like protein